MLDDLVVVDTDVFSRLLITPREQDHEATVWRLLLLGKQLVIAAQTEGEIRFGAQGRNWGPARMHALNRHFMATATLPVSSEVISAFASLRATCVQAGHPLGNKVHMGDAWVAASAHAYGLKLLSGDAIFTDVPGRDLLTE